MAKLKGTALLPAVKLIRKNRDKMEPFLDDLSRKFISQRILPGSWYPMEDATRLLTAICRFYGGNPVVAMEMIGTYCAESDLNGVYSHLIHPGDPPRSFRRAVMLWRNYQDSGTLHFLQPDPRRPRAILRLQEYAQTIPFCACILGMAKVVARLTGVGESFQIEEVRCTLRGESVCEFESTWG